MVLSLDINYKINTGELLSSEEERALYFYGITIQDRSGQALPNSTYTHFVKAATQEVEKYLGIKVQKQIISETLDFYLDEFKNWGYIQTTYPVVKPFKTTGFLGSVRQLDYPQGWLTCRTSSDKETYYRRIFIVPTQSSEVTTQGASILYSGVLPYTSLTSFSHIPNYWHVEYCTGFDTVPRDLLDVIGKLAAIGIFNIAGDIALGQAALASYSLSIDGLSQSISTTNSATNAAFGARIINYQKEIKDSLSKLRSYYKGVNISSM